MDPLPLKSRAWRLSPRAMLWAAGIGLALGALFALWNYTPLSEVLTPRAAAEWARGLAASPWAPVIIVLAYTPASLVVFPRALINIASMVAFGPWAGSAYALSGILLAGLATYVVGRLVNPRTLRRVAGRRVFRVSRTVRRGGIAAVTAVRMVPVAPFVIINMVAGAARVRVSHFVSGTALGMAPGITGAAIVGAQLREALQSPAPIDWWLIAAVAAGAIAVSLTLQWTVRRVRPVNKELPDN